MSVGHPAKVMVRAVELRAAKFSNREVNEILLREFGVTVCRHTISRWADPEVAARKLAEDRKRNQLRRAREGGARLGRDNHSRILQNERVIGLASTGMTFSNLVRVMMFDYPYSGWSLRRVEELLGPARAFRSAA